MAAALCAAVNDWMAKELLDREPRLRASILVPAQSPELAVREIERLAPDQRFVQVLLLAMGETPLGRRAHWPIYAAAEKHELAIGIHAGSTYRVAPTYSGWPSYRVEDYVAQSAAFETQLLSLVAEGVFQKFPKLKVVLIESGFTWLPNLLWRTAKTWRGVRAEVPWIDRSPAEIVREHVRFTLQPVGRAAGRAGRPGARHGAHGLGPAAAVLDRLSALAVRRRGRLARRAGRGHNPQDAGRQSARDLSAVA